MQHSEKKNKGMQNRKEEGSLSLLQTVRLVAFAENLKESTKLLQELIHELDTVTGC